MTTAVVIQIAIEIWGAFFCAIIALCSYIQTIKFKYSQMRLFAMEIVTFYILLFDIIATSCRGMSGLNGYILTRIADFSVQQFTFCLIILFSWYVEIYFFQGKQARTWHRVSRLFAYAGVVILLLNIKYNFVFCYDENNYFNRGMFWFVIPGCSLCSIFTEIILLFKERKELAPRRVYYLLLTLTLPVIASIVQIFITGFSIVYITFAVSIILMFFLSEIEKSSMIAEQERRITEINTKIMLTQVQPHFMFNTLTTIQYLCKSNPEEAAETIGSFSTYLRNNIDFVASTDMIPFSKELSHVKTYLDIEKKRFGDRINVEYDIEEVDFEIPPLSVQPMVENAVKHGVTKKKKGGTIVVSTKKRDKWVYVVISDDGMGYDTTKPFSDDRAHVGVSNVRERITNLRGGSFSIVSEPGFGTTVVMIVPAKRDF